jgi:DNA invertase Pin-like site-specific DNA recombinase
MKRKPTLSNTAALYIRVSTQEQAKEGISLEAQEAKLRTYCELRGFTVVELICDAGISGGKPLAQRPGGQRVLSLAQTGTVGHIVAYKLDRLFRDCADCLTVTRTWDKKEVALHLVDLGGQTLDTSSAMGRFFLTVMAGAAELERNLIKERTIEALAYKKSQGQRVGEIPYGYSQDAQGQLTPHTGEQEVIDFILRHRQDGLSLRLIVAALDKAGLVSRTRTPIGATQVARILKAHEVA